MKTIYLVRHGESENNASGTYNTPDAPLSERGRAQAEEIAARCSKLPIDAIVSSTIVRANDTAEVISARIGKPIEFSDLFLERRMASSLQGRLRKDPDVLQAMSEINANLEVPGYRYEDGENFEDLKERVLASLKYLEERSEENILVVTHGFFMHIIAAAVIFGEELSGAECRKIFRGLQVMRNTGITVLAFEDDDVRNSIDGLGSRWQLRVWNDHAHLG
ncbi:hypothetical protein A3C18_03920 [Candidatus Kaiserbacteria bacterium RIFCSPHIGHO2_02_FULL_54_11b]|uniref:Phosphoglycerate mutase n=1 Tax=Candidatus Kaiserbacteria bacterium RIFCSPHIGHO2_02_FULL_54_11b TaxID=1798494 RepID=A0A1F6DRM9_9BACT|nr:MAG: hypothetical protein A3C18_03920 [Candidatus Kaiserbacteria bacterium RIFCSPHIGHO2_02_FULL_54_11b]